MSANCNEKSEGSASSSGVSDGQSFKTMNEYAEAVRNWLQQYYWHQCNYYTSWQMQALSLSAFQQAQFLSSLSLTNSSQLNNGPNVTGVSTPIAFNDARSTQRQPVAPGIEYKIPNPWKRMAAEIIDFIILFVLKLFLTLVVVDYIELLNISHYDWEKLAEVDFTLDTAITMSTELFAMEIANRVITCFYEAMCLRRGVGGTVGGTTPGKRAMGIKVVSCSQVTSTGANKVRVIPAEDLGFWRAFVRSSVKNFSLALFFPVFLSVLFNQHNRATYDVLSSSIVVEEDRQN